MLADNSFPKCKLCPLSLGVAIGVTKALALLLLAWVAVWTGHGGPVIDLTSSIYHGYAATYVGGLIGAGWGLLDGFICGVIIALVYNCCLCCCCKRRNEL